LRGRNDGIAARSRASDATPDRGRPRRWSAARSRGLGADLDPDDVARRVGDVQREPADAAVPVPPTDEGDAASNYSVACR
jgi:hypothetical protein